MKLPLSSPTSNEMERLLNLSALDLNYTELNDSLKDLTRLAAGIAGTEISLVNLIDTYTQWSLASHGIQVQQMPREDSICQYTILEEQFLEVPNLASDDRFKDKEYVASPLLLNYYLGVPLITGEGKKIGALCVLDKKTQVLDLAKVELLKIIAKEIVVRLESKRTIELLQRNLADMQQTRYKLAHDIRGPLSGISGIAGLFRRRLSDTSKEKIAEAFSMIEKGSESLFSLAEDIMAEAKKTGGGASAATNQQFNLPQLKEVLEKLYLPMAQHKNIHFSVQSGPENEEVFFAKHTLLQISGNLISNAIKFTPEGGSVTVSLTLDVHGTDNLLRIVVEDSGVGISAHNIHHILEGSAASTDGTLGENGYGFGLPLVKQLVDGLNGTLQVFSKIREGTRFEILLHQKKDHSAPATPTMEFARLAM